MNKKIMLVAGEVSGDLQGSLLARSLKVLAPKIKLFGMGGPRMKEMGVDIKFDVLKYANIGIWENAKNYFFTMRRVFHKIKKVVQVESPSCIVLIDYQGFNLALARFAKKIGIPLVYYIPPQYWAWRTSQAKNVARLIDKIIAVMPDEEEAYRKAGADVVFVGNPLMDIVKVPYSREDICRMLILNPDAPVIGLFPGSRFSEVKRLLPVMLKSAEILRCQSQRDPSGIPDVQFVLPVAAPHLKDEIETMVEKSSLPVKIVDGRSYEVMSISDFAIICSGLATLEAAILGTPMVVVYKVSLLTSLIARILLKIPRVSPPNILVHREIVPELLQARANPENIAHTVSDILHSPDKMKEMRQGLSEAISKLGPSGAPDRAAEIILETIKVVVAVVITHFLFFIFSA